MMGNFFRVYKKILFVSAFIFALFYLYSNFAEARPGGGHSSRSRSSGGGSSSRSSSGGSKSSGGSRSSSFGGSSSSGSGTPLEARDILIFFTIIGIFLVIVVIVNANQNKTTTVYTDNDSDQEDYARLREQAKYQLELLRSSDTNFSEMLFLDYVQLIFHKYYTEQGKPALKNLSPYFMNAVTGSRSMLQYKEIVINAMNIVGASNSNAGTEITVLIEANYTQMDAANASKSKRFLVEQEWTFFRQGGVQSLPPAKMQVLACPACGAPDSFAGDTKCNACGTDITPSISQWAVMGTKTLYSDAYESDNLVSYEQEMGTNDATIFDSSLNQQLHNFSLAHQISNLNEYLENFKAQLVIPTFKAIYTAWTNKTWNKTRHLVSDFLYETQNFWMQEYKNKGYTNHLKDIEVSQVQIAKVDRDAFYESFTVRIFASCLDYTTDAEGATIGGDKNSPRKFSEYWTFIRRAGVETQKKDEWAIFANCPACAAPLDKMGMSGECGYCSNKVSTGEFSWVLSRITQDEAYF